MLAASSRPRKREAPARSIEAKHNQISPANRQIGIKGAPLRYISDLAVATPRSLPKNAHVSLARLHKSQQKMEQGRFPGPVRANNSNKLSRRNSKGRLPPDRAPAKAHCNFLEGHNAVLLSLDCDGGCSRQGQGQQTRIVFQFTHGYFPPESRAFHFS